MSSTLNKFVPFRENDIRPDDLMQGHAERFSNDLQIVLPHKSEFVHVPCPACAAEDWTFAFDKNDFTHVTCNACGTLFLNPRPAPPLLEEFYKKSKTYSYWNQHVYPASQEARRINLFRPRAQRIAEICKKYGIERRVLLEVGAGFGIFCDEIKRLSLFERVIAVEPAPYLAESCREKGLEVIELPIEAVNLDQPVNVVACFELIEHLFDPAEFVKKCDVLGVFGVFFVISCPNMKGFDFSILGKDCDSIDFEHLNYFHPQSLSHLLNACGFEVLEILTPGRLDAELVRKKVLAGKFDLGTNWFLKEILLDRWDELGVPFQDFLVNNKLSSHMWAVARKVR